jgi:hypothetical protein
LSPEAFARLTIHQVALCLNEKPPGDRKPITSFAEYEAMLAAEAERDNRW